jgi:hypothetical protein
LASTTVLDLITLQFADDDSFGRSKRKMTRRHDSLVPLSHDHHHALAQARRLERTASMDDEADRRRATDDFINFYLGSLLRHFREEEELFFAPLIDEKGAQESVIRALTEHLRVHARVRRLKRDLADGEVEPNQLVELSKLLTAHVRFEERDLLPLVEDLLSEEELRELATSGRRDV